MAEMKEFKKITLEYFGVLQSEGLVPQNSILSKSVLETASGRRVWEMLRYLSDYAVRIEIYRNDPNYPLPQFMMSLSEYKEEPLINENGEEILVEILNPEESRKEHQTSSIHIPLAKKIPPVTNLSRSILNRNRMGAISQIQSQTQKFKEISSAQQTQKSSWIETSNRLNEVHSDLNSKLAGFKTKVKKSILKQKGDHEATNFEEIENSDIVKDALKTSLSSIDNIPVMDGIQENYIKVKELQQTMHNNGLLENLQKLIQSKNEDIKMNKLSEELIFKDLLPVQKEELRPKMLANPEENKKAIALENLIDQANRQTSDVIYMIENDRKALKMEELKESILKMKKSHQEKLNQAKSFNTRLEQKIAT
mmetsp:Transcript_4039/g.3374  ORF Transcript_4039/g.3374 Transcript_4039/m.3374 type:complete len:366 (-) Transcript_4039:24-1121(-)